MKTLFEIGADLRALSALLDESDGEITPDNEAAYNAWFAELGTDQGQKLDGYVGLLKQWEGDAALAQSVIDQFTAKLRAIENRIKRHKQRMLDFLILTNQVKVKSASGWEISVTKNGGKQPLTVDPVDPKSLPDRFQKVTVAADNDAIRKVLENGEPLDFARLVERGQHLRIR